MQEQGKHRSHVTKSVTKEHKRSKVISSSSTFKEQGKRTAVIHGGKNSTKQSKGCKVIYSSDAERKLDSVHYRLGDMVWAKVKSHPWWPGQLYDPALATASVMEFKRDSCFLIAFFGDSTFGWFTETEVIPYEPNFPQKSRQTSAHNFVDAVEDSLDEVRKRVKSGFTCRCFAAEDASKGVEKKDGLLYDRQFSDIRRGFEPAKLLSALKQLACSPFSFSQDTHGNTVAGAQTDVFRRLVSCKRLPEDEGTLQRDCVIDCNAEKTLNNRILSDKYVLKKRQSKLPSASKLPEEQQMSVRKQGLLEKLGGMNELGKIRKLTKGVMSKKGSPEISEESIADEGVSNGTVLEINNAQIQEHAAEGSNEGLGNVLDEERGIQERKHSPRESDVYLANVLCDDGNGSLVDHDAFATGRGKEHTAMKITSKASPEAEDMELVFVTKEPNTVIKKAKVEKKVKDHGSKVNASKKAGLTDMELSQARIKVKVAKKSKVKRFMENESTGSCRQIKKQKVLLMGKANADDVRSDLLADSIDCGLPIDSTVSDLLPTSEAPHVANKVTGSPTGLESNLCCLPAEPFLHVETGAISSDDKMPDMVLEDRQLCPKDSQQNDHFDHVSMEVDDIGSESVMHKNESDKDRKALNSFQAEISPAITGVENVKDAGLSEHRDLPMFQGETASDTRKKRQKTEGFSKGDNETVGQVEEEILETQLKMIEKSKDPHVSLSRADISVPHFDGSCFVQAFSCDMAEKMQEENPRLPRDNLESKQSPFSNTMLLPNKRAMAEDLLMGLKANNKRVKIVSLENRGKLQVDSGGGDCEKHRDDVEDIRLQNLHEELMFVAAKPLDVVNEEYCSAVCKAFTKFRKAVFEKVVLEKESEDSVISSSVAGSLDISQVGDGNNKTSMFMSEQIKIKAIPMDDPTKIEPTIVAANFQEPDYDLKQAEKGNISHQGIPIKRSRTVTKSSSSSSISLRPAFEALMPVCCPKDVLNRFDRVHRLVDAGERMACPSFSANRYPQERDLVISFPYGYALPSEEQIREVFVKFGELNVPRSRIDAKTGCAHVIFRNAQDAEAALSSMKVKPVFENARFWLRPIYVNRKEITQFASRNVACLNEAILSSNQPSAESKTVADEGRSRDSLDEGLLLRSDSNACTEVVADRTAVSNTLVITQAGGGEESALQSTYRLTNALIVPMNTAAPKKFYVNASGPNQGKLDEIYPGIGPSSVILTTGPMFLASPGAGDISGPFLALLRQLHDLVLSTGFVM